MSPVIVTINCCEFVDSIAPVAGVMLTEITGGVVVVVVVVVFVEMVVAVVVVL